MATYFIHGIYERLWDEDKESFNSYMNATRVESNSPIEALKKYIADGGCAHRDYHIAEEVTKTVKFDHTKLTRIITDHSFYSMHYYKHGNEFDKFSWINKFEGLGDNLAELEEEFTWILHKFLEKHNIPKQIIDRVYVGQYFHREVFNNEVKRLEYEHDALIDFIETNPSKEDVLEAKQNIREINKRLREIGVN